MLKLERRKVIIVGILSILLTFLQIAGWQCSMDFGSSFHQSDFFQNIGVLEPWQCIVWGIIEFLVMFAFFYFAFYKLEQRAIALPNKSDITIPRHFGLYAFIALYIIWLVLLWGCYPGFFNYDGGNQLPQFLYEESPYNAHHPLLHTLLLGTIVSLGYHIYTVDITFGVFLYNAFQMFICAACLSYALDYTFRKTRSRILTGLSFCFYAFCPSVVMFAMSTTKDVPCFSLLLVAVIRLLNLIEKKEAGQSIKNTDWMILGVLLALPCLLRKNIVYAVVVFAICSLFLLKKERIKQLVLYVGVIAVYFIVSKALLITLDAIPASINEALCVPYQQIARLYNIEGDDAFTEEELALLSEAIPPQALINAYDPTIGDPIKSNFNPGLEHMMNNKGAYLKLWAKKGLEYPKIYFDSILYNTYQAWYPSTTVLEKLGIRYFDITYWQAEYGAPNWQRLYDFYESVRDGDYMKYPIIRMLFSTGAMLWVTLITWFYGIWTKDKRIINALLLVLLVCGSTFFGPVAHVRYYLIVFYLMPVCAGLLLQRKNN